MDENKKETVTQTAANPPATGDSPIAPKNNDLQDLPEPKEDKTSNEPFYKKLRKGSDQFSAMPASQDFKPPPAATASVPNTPLPTQPFAVNALVDEKPKKFLTPVKLIVLILLLTIMGLITVSATLVATDYTIYEPPQPVKNFLEKIFSGNLG